MRIICSARSQYTVSSDYDDTQRENRKSLRLFDDNSVTNDNIHSFKYNISNNVYVVLGQTRVHSGRGGGFKFDIIYILYRYDIPIPMSYKMSTRRHSSVDGDITGKCVQCIHAGGVLSAP